ncbi:hypothetical protein PoB_000394700 [Plakobranchus ocellatus]|uniref:Secreted protein n=1 Tax=Plakobranchus ocellatus TaxID=259542 RepID=A0AAV3Y4S6_9GAST|nr:hypothetical protein PoB_000394700 [Plakobranchus ocellatus]
MKSCALVKLAWFLYIVCPHDGDLRFSGPPQGQGTCGRLEPAIELSLKISGRFRYPLCHRHLRFGEQIVNKPALYFESIFLWQSEVGRKVRENSEAYDDMK